MGYAAPEHVGRWTAGQSMGRSSARFLGRWPTQLGTGDAGSTARLGCAYGAGTVAGESTVNARSAGGSDQAGHRSGGGRNLLGERHGGGGEEKWQGVARQTSRALRPDANRQAGDHEQGEREQREQSGAVLAPPRKGTHHSITEDA